MSAHKSIDKICVIVAALALILAVVFCNGKYLGIEAAAHKIGYEDRIFDNSKVHTFDIVINDWDAFIETCESEIYTNCNVIIDGEAIKNVGIRGKGNTSLSSVRNSGSSRYSFKIEFDQYDSTKSYHGLDKLCLNNIIQDTTYMKDYLAYTLMHSFGVDAPLCSFVYITVNGEDWGLYLAVEAIEDSFLQRNYGSDPGELYKPDSMSFGGGRGNGMDFSMSDFMKNFDTDDEGSGEEESAESSENAENTEGSNGGFSMPGGFGGGNMQGFANGEIPEFTGGNMPDFTGGNMPDFTGGNMPGFGGESGDAAAGGENSRGRGGFGGFGGGFGFGMGSTDVKLQYSDDEFDSYSNIFNNAKTDVTNADKRRLINALKNLSEQTDLENTVDIEEVIRYFVVHGFLCNGDSYTGSMIHNYYLHEEDGRFSMIPWDYNLAFGTFSGSDAKGTVNSPIDTPVSGTVSDRPMIAWIFGSEEYTELYHKLYSEFINSFDLGKLIDDTAAMIDSYVQKDPTKFCTYEDFKEGVSAIRSFCTLRAESVKGQLDGSIPSTSEGQQADSSALIDTGDLVLSEMGGMGGGFGGGNGGGFGGFGGGNGGFGRTGRASTTDSEQPTEASVTASFESGSEISADLAMSFGGNMPEGFDPSQGFGGNMPEGFDPSQGFGGSMLDGFDPSQGFGGSMPDGFDPSQMPNGGFGGRSDRTETTGQSGETKPAEQSGEDKPAEQSDENKPAD